MAVVLLEPHPTNRRETATSATAPILAGANAEQYGPMAPARTPVDSAVLVVGDLLGPSQIDLEPARDHPEGPVLPHGDQVGYTIKRSESVSVVSDPSPPTSD